MLRYGALTIPVGMLFARRDRIFIFDFHRQGEAMKARLPALDLVAIDGHGHMLPLTVPDQSADLIRRTAARQQTPSVVSA